MQSIFFQLHERIDLVKTNYMVCIILNDLSFFHINVKIAEKYGAGVYSQFRNLNTSEVVGTSHHVKKYLIPCMVNANFHIEDNKANTQSECYVINSFS